MATGTHDTPRPVQKKELHDVIITTSTLEMWWLTKVKGFSVIQTSIIPRQNTLGQIRYSRRWVLDGSED